MTWQRRQRRQQAAEYLKGRTLEQALAAWWTDYEAPVFRERRPSLARLGAVIRRLAKEAETRDDVESALSDQRMREREAKPSGM